MAFMIGVQLPRALIVFLPDVCGDLTPAATLMINVGNPSQIRSKGVALFAGIKGQPHDLSEVSRHLSDTVLTGRPPFC